MATPLKLPGDGLDANQTANSGAAFPEKPGPLPGSWFVYIVRCADDTLYTGISNDVAARIKRHNTGQGAKYTRSRRPVQLVYQEAAADRAEAQRRENAIRRLRANAKRQLISDKPGIAPC
jgi:putative endonuclease